MGYILGIQGSHGRGPILGAHGFNLTFLVLTNFKGVKIYLAHASCAKGSLAMQEPLEPEYMLLYIPRASRYPASTKKLLGNRCLMRFGSAIAFRHSQYSLNS